MEEWNAMMLDNPSCVSLVIPADQAYLGVVRLTASGVAALHGFDIARIDDIKTAACEACFYLIDLLGCSSSLHLAFSCDTAQDVLDIVIDAAEDSLRPVDNFDIDPQMAVCVLETLVDDVTLTVLGPNGYRIEMHARRQAAEAER